LSPIVLSFALGVIASLVRSDLKFPDQVYQAMAIYLLFAIGLKGGTALSQTTAGAVIAPALAGVCLGIAIPLWSASILTTLGGLSRRDAGAMAAHYGSVSAVTFIACLSYLGAVGAAAEGFMPAILGVMEIPAIIIGLLIARGGGAWRAALPEIMVGNSVVLLAGGMVVGWLAGAQGYRQVAPFFEAPFQGVLCLFLLDMGMVAARRARDLRKVGPFIIAFAIAMPVLHGAIGVLAGYFAGLSLGGATALGALAASASYIAAPAAVRLALPEANLSLCLTASLAITFPFNLAIGLPLYYEIALLTFGA
jgi:hypothetical protein